MRDEWEKVTLGEVATISAGGTPSRERKDFWNGNIPWIKTTFIQNNIISSISLIDEYISESGLKNSSAKLFPKGTILLALIGQGKTRGQVALVEFEATTNQNAATIICSDRVNNHYLYQYLLSKYDELRCLSNSSGQGNLNLNLISSYKINLPPISAQVKIAETLSIWDSAIEKTEKLISEKEKLYKGYLNSFYEANDNCFEINKFAKESSRRNKQKEKTQVLSVTNKKGFVPPEQQFGKKIASEDLSNYKIIEKGQFAYNPSRINVGSIARLDDFSSAVLSPMYTVFEINKDIINSDYFLHWLSSKYAIHQIKLCAQGGVREIVGFEDFGKMKIKSLSLKEQEKIADFLNIEKSEISLLKKQLEQYKLQKQGLMQKLLTGEWRVK